MANEAGAAASTRPGATTASAISTAWRCCGPSASRPVTGVTSAPASSAAVSSHCAAESET
jgi:hypothetical protein